MASAIAVKGIRRIIDKLGDEVLEAAKKAKSLPAGQVFKAHGKMELDGKYGIDKHGEFGFVGNAAVNDNPVGDAGLDLSFLKDWDNIADGTMKATFEVSVEFIGE